MTDARAPSRTCWCCRCQKPADEWRVSRSPFSASFTLSVTCHGEVDECLVGDEFACLLSEPGARVLRFEAFKEKYALPEVQP